MSDEFGTTQYNNDRAYTNSGKEKDNASQRGNVAPKEFHDYSGQDTSSHAGSTPSRKGLLRSLTTAAVAAVAAAAVAPNLLAADPGVRFDYLYASDSLLEYVISFENWEEGDAFSVVVTTPNGYTVNEQPVEDEIVSGSVDGLKAGVKYEVVVKDGSTELASRAVTMATVRKTELFGVEHECKCAVDGQFHFTVSLTDENGYWSGFVATLTDDYGNSSVCDFSDSPTAEHTLAVNDAGMRGNHAVLRIVCTTTEPLNGDRTPRELTLYESEVSI